MIELKLTEAEYRRLDGALSEKLNKLVPGCDAYNEYASIRDKLNDGLSAYLDDEDPLLTPRLGPVSYGPGTGRQTSITKGTPWRSIRRWWPPTSPPSRTR